MQPVFSCPFLTVVACGAGQSTWAIFRRDRAKLTCVAHGVENGSVGTEWLQTSAAAMRAARQAAGRPTPLVMILPAHVVLLKHLKVPRVEAAKRERVIRFEAEQAIPSATNEVIWDVVVSGGQETNEDLLLAAAKLDGVTSLCAAARDTGFEVRMILPSALATRAAEELARPTYENRLLILNVGVDSATLLQVDGARFAARSWTLDSKVESVENGEAMAARLAQETNRSLMHFQRQNGLESPTRLMLAGEGVARSPKLLDLLGAKLKLSAQILDMSTVVELVPEVVAGGPATLPELTDLVGAAVLQLLPGQATMNLMPPSLRRREHLRQRQPWLVAAAALILGALALPLIHYHRVTVAVQANLAALEETLVPLRAREVRNRAGLEKLAVLQQQVAQLQSVQDRRAAWLKFLADLQERFTKVEDVWLENLQTVPAAKDTPMKLVVSGRMLDKTNPLAKVSPETFSRVKALLAGIVDSPFVAAVEGERFDHSRPGILKFDFVLVTDPAHPL